MRLLSLIPVLLLAMAPMPAAAQSPAQAPQKAEPRRWSEGDDTLRVNIIDLSPRFLDFHAAASAAGVDAEQRWTLWQQRYGFAAVPPTPEGQAMARRMLEQAWPRYAGALPLIRRGAKAMRPQPLDTLRAVAAVLEPREPVEVDVVAYVGAFDGNAFSSGQDGRPTVAVPLEMDERQREAILPHEMTHAVHIVTADLSGGWERSIAATLMQEGLATHVAHEVVPDRPLAELIEYTPGWWAEVQPKRRGILQAILPALEAKDGDTVFRFTMGKGPNGFEREAYAAGWWVIEHLRRQGMSLAEIARIPEAEMPAVARRAIEQMLAGSEPGS